MAPTKEDKIKPRWQPSPAIRDESTKEKFSRKARQNPFVPIGCLATLGALGCGLFSFAKGNSKMQQSMMRARVLAQGSTIIAIVAGLGYEVYSKSTSQ